MLKIEFDEEHVVRVTFGTFPSDLRYLAFFLTASAFDDFFYTAVLIFSITHFDDVSGITPTFEATKDKAEIFIGISALVIAVDINIKAVTGALIFEIEFDLEGVVGVTIERLNDEVVQLAFRTTDLTYTEVFSTVTIIFISDDESVIGIAVAFEWSNFYTEVFVSKSTDDITVSLNTE